MGPAQSNLALKEEVVETTMPSERLAWFAVTVAALGYFVDIFDLWLFSTVRVQSLSSLGLSPEEITARGAMLINWQQGGLLLGGLCWGILGDKRGRASVMFGSILIYSVANLLNAFVTTVEQYRILRFISGFGLAGEVGIGITLVTELLPKAKRGIGTAIVTSVGVSGAIFSSLAAIHLSWRTAYVVGGLMGLLLLFFRFLVNESGIYKKMDQLPFVLKRGSLRLLFKSKERIIRFTGCVLIGVPLYLCFGIFATFAPEIALGLGIREPISVAEVLFSSSIGITVGDLIAGLVSQKLQSRRQPILHLLSASALLSLALVCGLATTARSYVLVLTLMGVVSGYWACLITLTAEQFGTNLRATVTTAVPNLIRASTIILTTSFVWLKTEYSLFTSLMTLTVITYALAFMGIAVLRETYSRDLEFYEQ